MNTNTNTPALTFGGPKHLIIRSLVNTPNTGIKKGQIRRAVTSIDYDSVKDRGFVYIYVTNANTNTNDIIDKPIIDILFPKQYVTIREL